MPVIHATRYISKPAARSDKALETLKKAVENAKILNEYAKQEYDRAEERMTETMAPHPAWARYCVTDAYSFSLRRYLGATLKLNRYLLDCEFPVEQKALGAAA